MRVLIVDRTAEDHRFVEVALRKGFPGAEVVRVSGPSELEHGLAGQEPDLVVSDDELGWSSGLEVLHLVRERWPAVPVIMFAGTPSAETAVAAMKAGLDDYVPRFPEGGDRLATAAAVLLERPVAGRRADLAERRLQEFVDTLPIGLYRSTPDGRLLAANPACVALLGYYSEEELLGLHLADLYADPADREHWTNRLRVEGVVVGVEIQLRRKDGRTIWARDTARAIDADDGTTVFEGALEDITAERELHKTIEGAKMEWERTFDAVPDPMMLTDQDFTIRRVNWAMADLVGSTPQQLVGVSCCRALHGLDEPPPACPRETITPGHIHTLMWGPEQGLPGHFMTSMSPLFDAGESVTGYVHVLRDVSELKRLETEARHSEQRFRALAEANLGGVYIIKGTLFSYVNPSFANLFGYAQGEIIGRLGPADLTCPEDRPIVAEHIRRRLAGETESARYSFKGLRKDGGVIHTEVLGRRVELGDETVILGTLLDRTEQVKTQNALRESEERLRTLIDASPDVIYFKDARGAWLAVNRNGVRAFELEGSSYLGKTDTELAEENRTYREALLACAASDEVAWLAGEMTQVDEVVPHRDGTEHVYDLIKIPLFNEDGSRKALVVLGRDVTSRVRAERELTDMHGRLESLIESLPQGLLLLDPSQRVIISNPAARKAIGALAPEFRTPDPLVRLGTLSLAELLEDPDPSSPKEVTVGEPPSQHVFEVRAHAVASTGRAEWALVVQDVTEVREAAQRLQRQERLAAIGELAAGIAHDFNNLLQAITLSADMIASRIPAQDSSAGFALTIRNQAQRGANLVRQILDFSRKTIRRPQPVDVAVLLTEAARLLRSTIRENAVLGLECASKPLLVTGDPAQLQQMITNLVVNAADSMPNGGRIDIRADLQTFAGRRKPPLAGLPVGEWVVIEIRDTGSGMTKEVQARIFEPFFTTKREKHGTGLGLAQVYGIVKQHDGFIDVESKVGRGTRFVIYLPAGAQTAAEEELAQESAIPRQPSREQTVLVAEDDPSVRSAARSALETLGYSVLEAGDGREALRLWRDHGDEVVLVLTDVVMPGMGGLELTRRLQAIGASAEIVLMTGYPLDPDSGEHLDLGIRRWLQKPFTVAQLSSVIRDATSRTAS